MTSSVVICARKISARRDSTDWISADGTSKLSISVPRKVSNEAFQFVTITYVLTQ